MGNEESKPSKGRDHGRGHSCRHNDHDSDDDNKKRSRSKSTHSSKPDKENAESGSKSKSGHSKSDKDKKKHSSRDKHHHSTKEKFAFTRGKDPKADKRIEHMVTTSRSQWKRRPSQTHTESGERLPTKVHLKTYDFAAIEAASKRAVADFENCFRINANFDPSDHPIWLAMTDKERERFKGSLDKHGRVQASKEQRAAWRGMITERHQKLSSKRHRPDDDDASSAVSSISSSSSSSSSSSRRSSRGGPPPDDTGMVVSTVVRRDDGSDHEGSIIAGMSTHRGSDRGEQDDEDLYGKD